jgi:hypothetical protein
VHGIPGLKVKVCVDGQPAIRGFEYGERAVGVSVPAGTHRVRVVPAGKPCSAPKLLSHRYQLKPGENYTIVAAVRPDGAPRLAAFGNGVRPTDTGRARLTVRDTPQAPAVNVWAGGTKLIGGSGFSWGDGRTFAVPHDTYRVKVSLPGTKTPVIGTPAAQPAKRKGLPGLRRRDAWPLSAGRRRGAGWNPLIPRLNA